MTIEKDDIFQYRKLLFTVAYNMLGTISDAEDMVQDTYASWLESDKPHVVNAKFYLIRTVINKCISFLDKIRKQREAYIGTWLPEPIVSSTHEEPEDPGDKLSLGFLYLLERLTPLERGVIILREAFNISYQDISQMFNITEENCRQNLSRAKKKLLDEKRRFIVQSNKSERILHEFIAACENKNLDKLVDLLSEDVTTYADGGGKALAILKPLTGRDHLLQLMYKGMEWYRSYEWKDVLINGLSGVAFFKTKEATTPESIIVIETDRNNKIINVFYMVNPEKLQRFGIMNFN